MIRTLACCVLLLAWRAVIAAPATDPIDAYVAGELAGRKVPGAAVLVVRDGKVLRKQGYGFANVEHAVPVTPQTIFQSGSVGKQFTAAGILLLVEEGKLSLDDVLSRHFPGAPAHWHRTTVRQLLAHTSGIQESEDTLDLRRDYTEEEFLAAMSALPQTFEPGTQWAYSNPGYVILGLLTSRLSGRHWSEYQAERIFRPLGMATTRMISERDLVRHRAAGYEIDEPTGALVNQDWVSPTVNSTADGALYFSLDDLSAWVSALDARAFMTPASFDAWWTLQSPVQGSQSRYGFGWRLSEQRGEPVIEHGGSWQGFRASISRYPGQALTVVVLANSASAMPEEMGHVIAGLVEPRLRLRAFDEAARGGSHERLARRLRDVLEAWSRKRRSSGMSAAFAALPPENPDEAYERQIAAERLTPDATLHVLGVDPLSPAATALLRDGSVRSVEAVVQSAAGRWSYRIRLDGADKVVSVTGDR